ncbi:HslU--HslV peptidase proteolytic subunit [Aerococcaceae bacterium NML191292]|nr:HslU--HslV peptidase proteolytic subunit [Aerococcaceae bacterium NML210727]MCW6654097.1 HslU--HslV peptidase proteolytic subunit [Aerococcaceae bacterium NML201296]MCW6659864.1 HslU--HslV peptidase proteolytic subunit [Aerococcaceae bacterium NML191292]MCW6661436.1 HslU--HslV peptidase proteolytic subunit [Aerococcaceae bacterium NML201209]MCW6663107.1 HslU--HslV peptidase proteolytic subunit [Aerococcaceae bacterium NML190073]MCW6665012.1 HslU--HslV peptidase proteolytic subunit [Aerococc
MTTICAVKKNNQLAMAGDGQVTMGEKVIMKGGARKLRRIYNDEVIVGFAGGVADAIALSEMFEEKLKAHQGQLIRAAVEVAKQWRTDRTLQKLEALLIVMNKETLLLVSGTGEVIEPDDGVLTIGSGGNYALAAARALLRHGDNLSAKEIAFQALKIASEIDVFTNDNILLEEFGG